MPMRPQIVSGSHVLHRPWFGLQSVIVVSPDTTHLLFFYNGIHEKILSETMKCIYSLVI